MAIDTEKLARNATLAVAARIGMMLLPFVMAIFGFVLSRAVTSIDATGVEVIKTSTQIKLLEQAVKFGFDANKAEVAAIRAQLTDHEGRLRIIERTPSAARSTP